MKKNVGSFDGVFRLILSFVIFAFAMLHGPWWLAFISAALVANAALFYCPLYDIAGYSTCDKNEMQDNAKPYVPYFKSEIGAKK